RLLASYRAGPRYLLHVDLEGQAGGIFSRALGVPNKTLVASGEGSGDEARGEEHFRAALGEDELAAGQVNWTPALWSTTTRARLDLLPGFGEVARRIGPRLAVDAGGARIGRFSAHAETPFITLDMTGAIDEQGVTGGAHFVAVTGRLSDIARECPFPLTSARLEGEIRQERGATALRGVLSGAAVQVLGQHGA